MTVFLPTPGQALVDPRTGHFTSTYRRWANALTEAVNAAQGSTVTVPAEPVSFVISGAGSVTADGSVAGGEFVVTLVGDKDNPPPNSFYGATTAGDKGFVPVYDALVEGTGIAIRDSGYIVIDTVETPDDLPLTGNSGEAVRVTGAEPGLYAWDGAAFTIDTAADGSVSVALDTLADSGAGTFRLLTRDTYGRLSGTKSGTASDVPYSNTTSGLAATNVQAAVDEVAAAVVSSGAWLTVKKTADQSRSGTTTKADDAELKTPSLPPGVYRIRGSFFSSDAGTGGLDYTGAFSGTASVVSYRSNRAPSGGAVTSGSFYATNAMPSGTLSTAVGTIGYVQFEVILTVTVAGIFSIQWAQQVSSASAVTILAGSYVEYLAI